MRIVVHGQQAFGKSVLDALVARGEEVIAVYGPPTRAGARLDPLLEAAHVHNLPVHQPASLRRPDVWDTFAALKPDLCVMAYVTLFVPEDMLQIPTHGTIQYHPSLLPRHRGPSAINWPIIWGERHTGVTIFWPDNGLDTGPILLQKAVDIEDTDTVGSLYFDHLYPVGVEALLEAVEMVRQGTAPKIPQDNSAATYEGWCKKDQVGVDWHQPLQTIWNLIRGADPQPGAWTTHLGQAVHLYAPRKVSSAQSGYPGEILQISKDGVTVAVPQGAILIERVRPAEGAKIAAHDFAREAGWTPGLKLGT
jgi:methionyl-tRNA formyltransferase